jgi:hypothetical protein
VESGAARGGVDDDRGAQGDGLGHLRRPPRLASAVPHHQRGAAAAPRGAKLVLEVDHVEGKVINELVVRPPDAIDLWEQKRRYHARFLNQFEAVPGGTRFRVRGDIYLKGWARLLQPFLRGYVRRQMRRLQLQPVKDEAQAHAGHAADGVP